MMKDGWALKSMNDINGHCWLSKGNEHKTVYTSTVYQLLNKQAIRMIEGYPIRHYEIILIV